MASSSSLGSLLASIAPQLNANATKTTSGSDAKSELFQTLLNLVNQNRSPSTDASSALSNADVASTPNVPSSAELAMQLLDLLTASENSRSQSGSTSVIPDFQLPAKLQAYAEVEKLSKSTSS